MTKPEQFQADHPSSDRDQRFSDPGTLAPKPDTRLEPQVGRAPNRPPYEQFLRVTKAFIK